MNPIWSSEKPARSSVSQVVLDISDVLSSVMDRILNGCFFMQRQRWSYSGKWWIQSSEVAERQTLLPRRLNIFFDRRVLSTELLLKGLCLFSSIWILLMTAYFELVQKLLQVDFLRVIECSIDLIVFVVEHAKICLCLFSSIWILLVHRKPTRSSLPQVFLCIIYTNSPQMSQNVKRGSSKTGHLLRPPCPVDRVIVERRSGTNPNPRLGFNWRGPQSVLV